MEIDPTRAPHHKHVHYLEDGDDEWGYFQKGAFHTFDNDCRAVRGVTLPGSPPIQSAASAAASAAERERADYFAATEGFHFEDEPLNRVCLAGWTAVPYADHAEGIGFAYFAYVS